MKKLLSIILALSMLLSVVGVSAQQAAPVAEKLNSTSIVNVTGEVESGSYVNLLLLDAKDEVKHVQEVKPDADGKYRAKFKFTGSTDGLTLSVKQGNANVTGSVIDATLTENEAFSYTFGVTTLKTNTMAIAEFENYFNIEDKTYVMMIAFYDKEGTLIDVKIDNQKAVGFDETSSKLTLDFPEGTETVKSFIWDSVEKMIPLAKEKTTKPAKELNILTIGNSFTDDPTTYLDDIAKNEGFDLKITKAHHGGSSIWQHWIYHKQSKGFYGDKIEGTGEMMTPTVTHNTGLWTYTLLDYIKPDGVMNKSTTGYYDIITIQQVSNYSGLIESYGFDEYENITPDVDYDNCAENLVKELRKYQPNAEIVLQQTWSYEKGSTHAAFKNYGNDREKMFDMIEETIDIACEKLAKVTTDEGNPISLDGKPLRYIPTGAAFQNARNAEIFGTKIFDTTYVKDVTGVDPVVYTLHRDGYHSSHLYGRYLGALVWYGALSGNSPIATNYTHQYNGNTIDANAADILKNAAQNALDAYGRWN